MLVHLPVTGKIFIENSSLDKSSNDGDRSGYDRLIDAKQRGDWCSGTLDEPQGASVYVMSKVHRVAIRVDSWVFLPFWAQAYVSAEDATRAQKLQQPVSVHCSGGRLSSSGRRVIATVSPTGLVTFVERSEHSAAQAAHVSATPVYACVQMTDQMWSMLTGSEDASEDKSEDNDSADESDDASDITAPEHCAIIHPTQPLANL